MLPGLLESSDGAVSRLGYAKPLLQTLFPLREDGTSMGGPLPRNRETALGGDAPCVARQLMEVLPRLLAEHGRREEEAMNQEIAGSNRFEVLGIELEWRLRRGDTLGHYCVMTATMPPGTGVPLHQHPEQEAFFILEGEPEFAVESGGLNWTHIHQGEMINIPPDAMHGFRNAGDRNVKILLTCEGELGKFFEEAGTPLAEDESPSRDPSLESIHRVLEVARRLGQRFPEPA